MHGSDCENVVKEVTLKLTNRPGSNTPTDDCRGSYYNVLVMEGWVEQAVMELGPSEVTVH